MSLNMKTLTQAFAKASAVIEKTVQTTVQEVTGLPKPLQEHDLADQIGSAGPGLVWKLFSARSRDGHAIYPNVCVWVLDKRVLSEARQRAGLSKAAEDSFLDIIRADAARLVRLRHPGVVHVVSALDESKHAMAMVTEPLFASAANALGNLENIENVPKELKGMEMGILEVKYGLLQIAETLDFLHNNARLIHRSISPESIMITSNGAWKLGGFDFTITTDQSTSDSSNVQAFHYAVPRLLKKEEAKAYKPIPRLIRNLSENYERGLNICWYTSFPAFFLIPMPTDYIPDEVLVNVLLRLPFDSLFRFKCVSKSWRNLIDSSYFKEMHTRSPIRRHSKMIAFVRSESGLYSFYTFGYTEVAKKLNSPNLECLDGYDLKMTGSCNGIVSFTSYYKTVLWNPFTRSTLNCEELISPPDEFTKNWGPYITSALAYDHLNDDYKLVKWHLNAYPTPFDGHGYDLYEVCVYSFKHKSWTTITDAGELGLHGDGGYFPESHTFANGAMHWLMSFDNLILAFDIATYKFQKIPSAPIPESYYNCYHMRLSSLNDRLSFSYTSGTSADIWVMKEYGVESSWTKIACVDIIGRWYMIKAVAYSEERRKLLLELEHGAKLLIYDLDTKSSRDVPVIEDVMDDVDMEDDEDEDSFYKRCTSCVCVETFVSPHLF